MFGLERRRGGVEHIRLALVYFTRHQPRSYDGRLAVALIAHNPPGANELVVVLCLGFLRLNKLPDDTVKVAHVFAHGLSHQVVGQGLARVLIKVGGAKVL